MTVSTTANRVDYIGNGALTTYAYPFRIFVETDLLVYIAGTLKSWPSDFTVTGVGNGGGGNVVFSVAPTGPIAILRSVASTQLVDYVANDSFPAETHEAALDRLTMLVQQELEAISRAIAFGPSSTFKNLVIDDLVAGKLLSVKGDLSGIQMSDVASTVGVVLPLSIANGGTGGSTAQAARNNLLADQDNRTNTMKIVATLKSTTTAAPAAGIGVAQEFQAQAESENPSVFGRISFGASDVGPGSVRTYFDIWTRAASDFSAIVNSFRLQATFQFKAILQHFNTDDRTYTLPDASGKLVVTTAAVDLINATPNIGATNLYTVPAGGSGIYRLTFDMVITATGAGNSSLQFVWNNGVAAQTVNTTAFSNGVLGAEDTNTPSFRMYIPAGQSITYALNGTVGTVTMNVRIRLEYLG